MVAAASARLGGGSAIEFAAIRSSGDDGRRR
jgi:hypothetical protein